MLKKYNLEFNIDKSDIIVPEFCPLLEVKLIRGDKNNYKHTHSIDRIDSSKGYIKGNIQIMSMKANTMKNSSSLEELIIFAKNVILQNKDHDIVQELKQKLNI